jgi:hypothetical protein
MRTISPAVLSLVIAASAGGNPVEVCGTAVAIPDGGSVERVLVVPAPPAPRSIVSVRVRLEGTHPWVGDLRATLVHPSGLAVTLLDRPGLPSTGFPGPWGCGGDDFRCTLADDAPTPVESTCSFGPPPVLSGTLRPNAPLSALVGLAPEGAWRLVVDDAVAGDAGTLTLACLELTLAAACPADLDGNAAVDAADLAAILAAWGPCAGCPADLDGDGQVAASDLTATLAAWGSCERP